MNFYVATALRFGQENVSMLIVASHRYMNSGKAQTKPV